MGAKVLMTNECLRLNSASEAEPRGAARLMLADVERDAAKSNEMIILVNDKRSWLRSLYLDRSRWQRGCVGGGQRARCVLGAAGRLRDCRGGLS
jgi:hypothetical protein